MLDKHTIKNTLLSVVLMGIVSVITLVILSVLVFLLKWQAPQAQVGITLTYIVSGFFGGFFFCSMRKSRKQKEEVGSTGDFMKNTLVYGMTLGTIYMAVLLALSILISANEYWDLVLIFLRWILLSASCVFGIFIGGKGLWNLVKKR